MAALPVYILAPDFYADTLGMPLALLGAVLLGTRLIDTVQDPLLGYWSDRLRDGHRRLTLFGVPVLAVGFTALFNPPALSGTPLLLWLVFSLILAYSGYSMSSIGYQAWGAELTSISSQRTRVTAAREASSLAGVLLAALLPQLLMDRLGVSSAMVWFSAVFVVLLVSGVTATLATTPAPPDRTPPTDGAWRSWRDALSNRAFARLCAVFLLNGMAAAVPATLVLLYVEHVLGTPRLAGVFLATYFLAGMAGMPLWTRLAARWGKRDTWLVAMTVAVGAFVWAFGLDTGDVVPFLTICLLSGMALGADLALPPAMLADLLADRDNGEQNTGSHFGLWNLLAKLSLALAAGTALPLLQALGFSTQTPQSGVAALAVVYALLPCGLKLLAMAVLLRWSPRLTPQEAT